MKHTLKADGAPHAANGDLVNSNKSTAGKGRARCSCGQLSEILDSRAARKMWFNGHKANPVVEETTDDAAAPEPEVDDIIGTPPPAKKVRKGSVDIDAEFSGGYAIEFARFVVALGQLKGLDVVKSRNGSTRQVTIVGGTKTMAKMIDDVEVEAMEALHEWQGTAPERAEQTAGERYKGSRAFLATFLGQKLRS